MVTSASIGTCVILWLWMQGCHQPETVLDIGSYELFNDFDIYTDRAIARSIKLLCHGLHVVDMHKEKIEKYLDLVIELQL